MKFFKYVICVFLTLAPSVVPSPLDIFSLMTGDAQIWKCVTELDESCVSSLGKKPVEELFKAPEFRLGKFVSIEKMNSTDDQRDVLDNIWDMGEVLDAGVEYVKSHALKVEMGDLQARMFASRKEPESVELTVEARKGGKRGQSQKIYRVVIPLIVGFKITGLIIFGLVAVKFFLMKATLMANTALMVAGGIVMKKLYDHGMGMLSHHHSFLNSHHSMPNFYSNSHDFSGYGYNNIGSASTNHAYGNGGFGSQGYETQEVPETALPELGSSHELQGQYSNHAIALAALNRTLMQQQHQQPKRRWASKWSNFHR